MTIETLVFPDFTFQFHRSFHPTREEMTLIILLQQYMQEHGLEAPRYDLPPPTRPDRSEEGILDS